MNWASLVLVSASGCIDTDPEPFFVHSGASTSSWQRAESGDHASQSWVETQFQIVEDQARSCWSRGGRYWETDLDTSSYVATLRIAGSTWEAADCPECLQNFVDLWNGLPDRLLGGICAHALCDRGQVQSRIYPLYLSRALHVEFALPSPAQHVKVRELSHWSQLRLDFVVGGINSCGTTSMAKALDQIGDIDFTMDGEDNFFYRHDSLLPYREEVESFNFQWLSHSCSQCLRGLRHPGLYHSHRVRLALAHIPRLKVVIVVCDPVSRFEKWFWMFLHCKSYPAKPRHKLKADGPERCFHSPASALEEPEMLRQSSFGFHLRSLHSVFGSRLRVIHQAHLRHHPIEACTNVVQFLGARMPPSFKVERHNHQRGYRTNMCQNQSLVADLQKLLLEEYDAMEVVLSAAGGGLALPKELQLRQTRCDRPEEMQGMAPEVDRAPLLVAMP
ncbi:TY2B-C [Symbiodinium natans]|uniref:TY2B-C protein n=1 Tax=Symbiodinium natans TaxID=878477 RepID=A0A812PI68_9DINO|nr:TY2B-C [Symbiodinium natans]